MMLGNCGGGGDSNCGQVDPPPDSILLMPPPPLPSFLQPKTATAVLNQLPTNDSHPCFANFMCNPSPHPRESGLSGIDFVELSGENGKGLENTWLFVLISSVVGVLILGGLLAVILLKCRDALFSSCNFTYHDSNIKQNTMTALGDAASKANPFITGGILYPCTTTNNHDTLQSQMANDSRLLWATLTPHGTRHFISDYPHAVAVATTDNNIDGGHYEVVDYRHKVSQQSSSSSYRDLNKRIPNKSFENNGFVDYDYEDPTPLMDSYHDDLDSGYQEPQEVIGNIQRASPRPHVSSPTRIDHPNIAPLNYYPTYRGNLPGCVANVGIVVGASVSNMLHATSNNNLNTLNRGKNTLNRRISDASSFGSPNM